MSLWAIVPLKILTSSKQRLSGVLTSAQRVQLAQAMAEDVLSVLKECQEIDHILLISDDAIAATLCATNQAEWLKPQSQEGLNEDLAFACNYAEQQGASTCLILHADLPLLNSSGVDQMVATAKTTHQSLNGAPMLAVVPCKQGTGSNLLYAPLPFPVELVYGKNSYLRFQQLATENNIDFISLTATDGDLDVDIPADLESLRQRINASGASWAKSTRQVMSQIRQTEPQ